MKKLLLLSILAAQAYAAPTHRNQINSTDGSNQSPLLVVVADDAEQNTPSGCPAKAWCRTLVAQARPFGIGVLSGAWLACLETMVVSRVLAPCSDVIAVSIETALLGALGYKVYTNEDNDLVQEVKKPAGLLGLLAGVLVWYQIHG